MKKILIFLTIFYANFIFSQENLNLEKVIEFALTESELYKKANSELSYADTNYSLYKKELLPNIYISSLIPSIFRSVTRVTTPEGLDIFVNQNQASYDLNLSIEQREPILGGTFEFSTFINRIDIFSDINTTSYFSTPFSLAYSNDNLLLNSRKYEKKINSLKQQEAISKYNFELENIVYESVNAYLSSYIISKEIEDQSNSLIHLEDILSIAQKRFDIGSISKEDILLLKINIVDVQLAIDESIKESDDYRKKLSDLIKKDAQMIQLIGPTESILNIQLSYDTAHKKMISNNGLKLELERKIIEKELEEKKYQFENRLSVGVNAFYGLSNTGLTFNQSTSNLLDRQSYSLSIRYLLSDFGKSKQKAKLINIESELDIKNYEIEIQQLSQDLNLMLSDFYNNQKKATLIKKKLQLAENRYDLLKKKFSLGTVTVDELIRARDDSKLIDREYYRLLKESLINYYAIRKITMYDFIKKKDINYL